MVPHTHIPSPGVFAHTFRKLHQRGKVPQVLYPAVSTPSDADLEAGARAWRDELPLSVVDLTQQGPMFLSINRYERKKVSRTFTHPVCFLLFVYYPYCLWSILPLFPLHEAPRRCCL